MKNKPEDVFKQDTIEMTVWFILIFAVAIVGMIYGG